MIRTRFNTNWKVNSAGSMMSAMMGEGTEDKTVTLPYDCMLDAERTPDSSSGALSGFYPAVASSYTREFEAPKEWEDKLVIFEFEGAYMNAMVYINGDYVGGCPHGYSNFYVEANRFLRYGQENKISVNIHTAEDSRWYSGAGLYRNVNILVSELTHIVADSYRISTPEVDDEGALVTLDYELKNSGHKTVTTSVVTILKDAEGNVVGERESTVTAYPGEIQNCRQSIYLENISRWSIDTPYLYQAETKVYSGEQLLDKDETTFGIRTLQLDPKHGLRINGEVVKLRGACIHHDNGLIGSAAIERAEERRAELLKKAGFNAVRSAHNPISKAFLKACDKIGMVVMDEITDMWTRPKTISDFSLSFPFFWEKACEAMVGKDYNHPCVIMYSIGNEIPETGTPNGASIGRKMMDKIIGLDSTRYILNSINVMLAVMDKMIELTKDKSGGEINEFMNNLGDSMSRIVNTELVTENTKESYDCVDICGYNYATARYELDGKLFPNRVLIGSETSPKEISDNWTEITRYSHVIGDFTWTGWDYLGEAGIGKMEYVEDGATPGFTGAFPWYIGYCGDLDITGLRRPISYYREIVFGLSDQPYIVTEYPSTFGKTPYIGIWNFIDGIGSWSFRGYEGKQVRVHVFGTGDTFKLFLNGGEVGAGVLEKFRGYADLTYQPGELKAVTYSDGAEIGTAILQSAGDVHHLEVTADRTEIRADDTDLCYVDIAICDEKGIVDNMADRLIRASVIGAGELKALGTGNPKTTERFDIGAYTSFDGRALAIIRPAEAGEIILTVEAEGLEPVQITITAK